MTASWRKANRCTVTEFLTKPLDNTTPTSVSEVLTLTVNYLSGSECLKMEKWKVCLRSIFGFVSFYGYIITVSSWDFACFHYGRRLDRHRL